jgi:hypothetical protein
MATMPDVIEVPSDLCLTPHGLLHVERAEAPSPWLDLEAGRHEGQTTQVGGAAVTKRT